MNNWRDSPFLPALLGGTVGAVFGTGCFLLHTATGAMALGTHLFFDDETYLSDEDAIRIGALTGVFAAILGTILVAICTAGLNTVFASFLGKPEMTQLHMGFAGLEEHLFGWFWANLLAAVILGALGSSLALRGIYSERRIPRKDYTWTP